MCIHHRMAINRKRIVGIAGNRNEAESILDTLQYPDDSKRTGGATGIAALSVDQRSIGCRNETSLWCRDMIPDDPLSLGALLLSAGKAYQSANVITVLAADSGSGSGQFVRGGYNPPSSIRYLRIPNVNNGQ